MFAKAKEQSIYGEGLTFPISSVLYGDVKILG